MNNYKSLDNKAKKILNHCTTFGVNKKLLTKFNRILKISTASIIVKRRYLLFKFTILLFNLKPTYIIPGGLTAQEIEDQIISMPSMPAPSVS